MIKTENKSMDSIEKLEHLFDDQLGGNETYDSLPANFEDTIYLLEFFVWGTYLMKEEGVLNKEHTSAMLSYWETEARPRMKQSAELIHQVHAIFKTQKYADKL